MGCSSCGKRAGAVASARQAGSRTAAQMPAGFSVDNPVLFGEPNEHEIQVRVIRQAQHLRVQQKAWVTGDGVQALLDDGSFVDITNVAQRSRLFMVAGFPQKYLSREEAQEVAKATGSVVVEVA